MIKFYKILSLIIIIILPEMALSSQIQNADDGAEITAIIARQDLSRIRAIGDRIRAVKKNEGEFTATIDEKLGDIYIRPSGALAKPINLYLITEKGFTYKILLTLKDIPSQQIFIKNNSVVIKSDKEPPLSSDVYTKKLITLYKLMAQDLLDKDYSIATDKKEKYDSNNKIKLTRIKQLIGKDYIGEIYDIVNLDKKEFIINEQNFSSKGVLLVSSRQEKLAYKQHCLLYIIKEAS